MSAWNALGNVCLLSERLIPELCTHPCPVPSDTTLWTKGNVKEGLKQGTGRGESWLFGTIAPVICWPNAVTR